VGGGEVCTNQKQEGNKKWVGDGVIARPFYHGLVHYYQYCSIYNVYTH